MNIETIIDASIDTHLWVDTFTEDPNTDVDGRDYKLSPESRENVASDVREFVKLAGNLLNGMEDFQIGHDFALTRNGHGAGFWDRGLGELGDNLTEISSSFSPVNGYLVGDTVHLEIG